MDGTDYAKSYTTDRTIDQVHGYVAFFNGKPMIGSDGKIFYNKKETCASNFRWNMQRYVYNKMIDNNQVPEITNRWSGVREVASFWQFKSTPVFQREFKKFMNELKSSHKYEIKYL